MSLFPAYSNEEDKPSSSQNTSNEWLENNSFKTLVPPPSISPPEEKIKEDKNKTEIKSVRRVEKKSSHVKKKKRRKEKKFVPEPVVVIVETNDPFFIDKDRDIGFLSVKTLKGRSKPRYTIYFSHAFLPRRFINKSKRPKRYFNYLLTEGNASEEIMEGEMHAKNKVEELNKKLDKDSKDVETWIELAEYQDVYYKFLQINYKTTIERERAAMHRKLNILDKAMEKNANDEKLQKIWLDTVAQVLPSEEATNKIENYIKDTGGSFLLWLGLIRTTQHSLSRSSFPDVTNLYTRAISSYQRAKLDCNISDNYILELLFHYCKFLDHAGHWELLVSIIKMNLQFNISHQLSYDTNISDEKSKELENKILDEGTKAPIWLLWNRLEELREGIHFMPVSNSLEYPQRIISSENFINFIIHFNPNLQFKLTVMSLMLLKIPLLPTSDVVLEFLSKDKLPWIFDSIELILSSAFNSPVVKLKTSHLKHLYQLMRGPQYLRRFHGQSEFLDLIFKTFEGCINCLNGRQKSSIGVWWLRFQRWINILDKNEIAKLPPERKKPKIIFKEFLKIPENRDNSLYYCEYSLLEYEQGSIATSIKTLQTVISSKPPVLSLSDIHEQSDLCFLYRTLCEILIADGQRDNAVNVLVNLANGMQIDNKPTVNCSLNAVKKFEHLTIELIYGLGDQECDLEDLMLPIFAVEWISCYMWLMAYIKPMSELKSLMDRVWDLLDKNECILAHRIREVLYENILTIYWVLERQNQRDINDVLQQGFSRFPQNLTLLSFMASNEFESCRLWTKTVQLFLSPPTIPASIMLSCVALEKFLEYESMINRIKGLLRRLTEHEARFSSIIQSLRLQFLHQHKNMELKSASMQALESCPWNKRVYTDSILYLPAELMQLTDILIEKELRIHITPDEIQEMRD